MLALVVAGGNFLSSYAWSADSQVYLLKSDLENLKSSSAWPRLRKGPHILREIDLGTSVGEGLGLEKNKDKPFTPASLTKIITSAAALEHLGPDYRFKMVLVWREAADGQSLSDLQIYGYGDPTLGMSDFDRESRSRIRSWALSLKERGIRNAYGAPDLVAAVQTWEAFQEDLSSHQALTNRDRLACYSAQPSVFNFSANCATLIVDGLNQGRWRDNDLRFPLVFSMTPGERTRVYIDPETNEKGRTVRYRVYGTWKPDEGSRVTTTLPVSGMDSWLQKIFISELRRVGIHWHKQKPTAWDGPGFSYQSVDLKSPALSEIIVPQNKQSINFLSEALFFTLGTSFGGHPAAEGIAPSDAIKKALNVWAKEIRDGHLAQQIQIYDGSGLSHKNKVTAGAVLKLLKLYSGKKYFSELLHSLPIAGVDGTLQGRFHNTRAYNQVRAKTGTLEGAYQLAGYIPKWADRNGEPSAVTSHVPFVILTSTTPAERHKARRQQDELVLKIFDAINPLQ